MLTFPKFNPIPICGIDPGTTNLGLATMYIDPMDNHILSLDAITLFGNKLPGYDHYYGMIMNDRDARLEALRLELVNQFNLIKPLIVGSETPFFNRLHPNAFGPLVETLQMERRALWEYNQTMPLIGIDPPTGKKAVLAKGNAKKDDMTIALMNQPYIKIPKSKIEQFDEHSVDACAITIAVYRKYVLGELK